ncbi:hypothetical protein KP509_34G069400 [Ceratopteris richardii]|uniref:Uncharacterized protein n=2 Tax=Ceratopteris richardii TaxID=49495 RepID=A0A8T2QN71_CERRI|nr:hypothetical protein KP509_34G069400 [Ceratopteris richardii]
MAGRVHSASIDNLVLSNHNQELEMKWIPWMVGGLILLHLSAFICWIYCLIAEKPTWRRKVLLTAKQG